jgi:hypothetical protein
MHGLKTCALLIPLLLGSLQAGAQETIERIKITDNDLGCQQIVDERNAMDKLVADAKAAQSSGQTTAVAGQAAGVAAEVAQRTGVFGALGGLTGHLFGGVASKAAASVAEQTGQQDAAKAGEREKQALGRKEHLTELFLAKGCSASNPAAAPTAAPVVAAAPVTAPVTVQPAVSPAPTLAAPVLAVLKADNMKGIKRVAVASFTVQFVEAQVGEVKNRAKLGTAGGVTLHQVSSRVVGVDFSEALSRSRMQETTNVLYQDLLKEIQAAGLELVPPEKLQAAESFKKFVAQTQPTPREEDAEAQKGSGHGAIRSVFMTPPGIPLVLKGGSGSDNIDWLAKGDSVFSSNVGDYTLTFTGSLSLYTTNYLYYEKDVQKELDTATLHVRVYVPLAVIEVDQGMNWSKAKIEPGLLLGNRFTRMTVGHNGSYSWIFLKDDLKVPGVITYTVEESPHPNIARSMLGEKVRTYPSTMNVNNYWRDVPEASRHVFRSFVKTLADNR